MVFGEDFNRGKTYLLCLTLIRKKPTWFRCILFDAIVMGEKSKSYFPHKISLDKISLDKISLGKISLDKISLDKISLGKKSMHICMYIFQPDLDGQKIDNVSMYFLL